MNVRLHELAQAELDDAFEWYEGQLAGLGAELAPGIRRCLLPRFPFGVIYTEDVGEMTILGVAHLHREPRYWVGRL